MFRILCMSLCVAVTLMCSHVVAKCAEFTVKEKQVFFAHEGKNILLHKAQVDPVHNSDMTIVTIVDGWKEGEVPVPAGAYIFDKAGTQIKSMANKDYDDFTPSEVAEASLSPDGKTLALDNGTSIIRAWYFLDYASLKVLGVVGMAVYGGVTWVDNQRVLVNYLTGTSYRRSPCGAESCEEVQNVGLVNTTTSQCELLFPDEPLCDVRLERYADGVVYAVQGCKTEKEWHWTEGDVTKPTERPVSRKLNM